MNAEKAMPNPTYTTLLEETLEAWGYTRQGVIDEVANLSEADLSFRPTPASRRVVDLVHHIIESGLLMSGELSRPDGDFLRKPYPALIKSYSGDTRRARSRRELIARLKRTHQDGEKRIRTAGELLMWQFIKRFDGQPGTRFAWMNHAISHEEYHRGQLALYARLVGRVPALTQQITG
jgi:uncharacterized damage-inducible protein DinB